MSDDYGTMPGERDWQGERVEVFGNWGVFAPYTSHDGPLRWSVQRIEPGSSGPEDMGEIIAEFNERHDAELFAEAKHESDDAAITDKMRDKYDLEPSGVDEMDCRDYPV